MGSNSTDSLLSGKQALLQAVNDLNVPDTIQLKATQTTDIEILAKHVESGKFQPVRCLLDTGANRDVGSLPKPRQYRKVLEARRRVAQIEFPDLSTKPVSLVGRLELILKQGNTKLNIAEQLVLLIDDPD